MPALQLGIPVGPEFLLLGLVALIVPFALAYWVYTVVISRRSPVKDYNTPYQASSSSSPPSVSSSVSALASSFRNDGVSSARFSSDRSRGMW